MCIRDRYNGWADLQEESDPQLEAKKLGGSWRMVAHVLLKNDFFCTGLAFNINLGEYDQYMELVRKHEAGEPLDRRLGADRLVPGEVDPRHGDDEVLVEPLVPGASRQGLGPRREGVLVLPGDVVALA